MFKDPALRSSLYNNIGFAVTMIVLAYSLFNAKKKKNSMSGASLIFKSKMASVNSNSFVFKLLSALPLIMFIEIAIFFLIQYLLPILQNPTFGSWVGSGTNYFGLLMFAPIFTAIFCFVLWVDPLRQMDFAVVSFPLALSVSKIACLFAGCCHGMEWENGVFNYRFGRPEFPIQLVESLIALLIFVVLFKYKNKAKAGTVYPVYLMLYCGTRFFSEFLRGEANVLGPLKRYHILCIAGFIVGIILYAVIVKYGEKITKLFEETTYFTKGKLHEKVVSIREEIANTDISLKAFINSIKSKHEKKQSVIK